MNGIEYVGYLFQVSYRHIFTFQISYRWSRHYMAKLAKKFVMGNNLTEIISWTTPNWIIHVSGSIHICVTYLGTKSIGLAKIVTHRKRHSRFWYEEHACVLSNIWLISFCYLCTKTEKKSRSRILENGGHVIQMYMSEADIYLVFLGILRWIFE